jgi:hypothetical protein
MTRYIMIDGKAPPQDWDDIDTLVDAPTPPNGDQERIALHWLQLNLTRIWTGRGAAYAELAVATGARPRDVALWAHDMFTVEAGLVYVTLPLRGPNA